MVKGGGGGGDGSTGVTEGSQGWLFSTSNGVKNRLEKALFRIRLANIRTFVFADSGWDRRSLL